VPRKQIVDRGIEPRGVAKFEGDPYLGGQQRKEIA